MTKLSGESMPALIWVAQHRLKLSSANNLESSRAHCVDTNYLSSASNHSINAAYSIPAGSSILRCYNFLDMFTTECPRCGRELGVGETECLNCAAQDRTKFQAAMPPGQTPTPPKHTLRDSVSTKSAPQRRPSIATNIQVIAKTTSILV